MSDCGCAKCSGSVPAGFDYQYAVKVVVGVIDKEDQNQPLPIGNYFTKVNVHNFSRCDCTTFRWKVAVGKPKLEVGKISGFSDATLCADEALEITNADIFAKFDGVGDGGTMASDVGAGSATQGKAVKPKPKKKPKHIEGWVVIESPTELDIVAVYSTAEAPGGTVNTFHTERVQPRCLPVCEDFALDISTGVSAWEVKSPGSANFELATLSANNPNWSVAMSGSSWVIPGTHMEQGDYEYRLKFKLCSGFRNPQLHFALLADDYANVFLNGQQIPPVHTSGTMYSAPTNFNVAGPFKAGENELRIVVRNDPRFDSPTGLDVAGSLVVVGGKCPGDSMPLLPCPSVCYQVYDREFWFNPLLGFPRDRDLKASGFHCGGESDTAGGTDGRRRIEKVELALSGSIVPGTKIEYRACVFDALPTPSTYWTNWEPGGLVGPGGADSPLTAVEIRLINAPVNCHIRYRVCTRRQAINRDFNPQWSNWYYDGATAGFPTQVGNPPFQHQPVIIGLEVEIV